MVRCDSRLQLNAESTSMEMIIISGAGTLVLLVALLFDYVLAPDLRRLAGVDGVPRSSGPELSVARPPSPDRLLTYDRAA
jgi:hypothetical protein